MSQVNLSDWPTDQTTPSIDTFKEKVISLARAAKHVAKISGKKPNRRALLRMALKGKKGVRLPTIDISGELYTSEEALNWYLNEIRKLPSQRNEVVDNDVASVATEVELEARRLGI